MAIIAICIRLIARYNYNLKFSQIAHLNINTFYAQNTLLVIYYLKVFKR